MVGTGVSRLQRKRCEARCFGLGKIGWMTVEGLRRLEAVLEGTWHGA